MEGEIKERKNKKRIKRCRDGGGRETTMIGWRKLSKGER